MTGPETTGLETMYGPLVMNGPTVTMNWLETTGPAEATPVSDITGNTTDCQMLRIMYNNQNFQIETMRGILEQDGYPEFNDCVFKINS
jgi:hypothetical protein